MWKVRGPSGVARVLWLTARGKLEDQSSAAQTCELTPALRDQYALSCDPAQERPRPPTALDSSDYYNEYHGHLPKHLCTVHATLRHRIGCEQFVYLAGDSSLDNKYWLQDTAKPVNGYEQVFAKRGMMVKDVSYWLNKAAEERFGSGKVCTMMTSVEESTMRDRQGPDGPRLLAQDV